MDNKSCWNSIEIPSVNGKLHQLPLAVIAVDLPAFEKKCFPLTGEHKHIVFILTYQRGAWSSYGRLMSFASEVLKKLKLEPLALANVMP